VPPAKELSRVKAQPKEQADVKQDVVMKQAKNQDDIPDSIYDQIPLEDILREAELSGSSEEQLM